ncbi:MAG: ATP-binding cassette domain-containing protein [bacterium]|nr:ATP-binding cassette domain-containing protein [Candidatus Limimorpha equi]
MEEILRVEHLCKTFELSRKQQKIEGTTCTKTVAVNDVSFSAYKGEIFGLLGPNGAGKTTTLRMLATLVASDSGNAFVNGCSVVAEPEKCVRKSASSPRN